MPNDQAELIRQNVEVIRRLDNLSDPQTKRRNLARVMTALQSHPSPRTAQLCVVLNGDDVFLEDTDRLDFLLETLAAVTPMGQEAVAIFRQTNAEGYFAFNAPLLAANASPLALELFESMIQHKAVNSNRRVDCLHRAVVPNRTSVPILQSAERLLSASLEPAVRLGLVESLFDFREKEWFGPAIGSPQPPDWDRASDEALRLLVRLAAKSKTAGGLPPALGETIDRTAASIQAVLARRNR
jgi:hypothetical protein